METARMCEYTFCFYWSEMFWLRGMTAVTGREEVKGVEVRERGHWDERNTKAREKRKRIRVRRGGGHAKLI